MAERVTITREGADALVTVDTGVAEALVLRFRAGEAVTEIGGDAARAEFAAHALAVARPA